VEGQVHVGEEMLVVHRGKGIVSTEHHFSGASSPPVSAAPELIVGVDLAANFPRARSSNGKELRSRR
jgi:hypothetical protein